VVVAGAGRPLSARRATFPLVFAGEIIGELAVEPRDVRTLPPADRRLLSGIARQVAVAAHAVSLTAALLASRERLVAATEEERRRLRRDLHDGLGPGLAGLVLGLQRARTRVAVDPDAAVEQLDRLTVQVQHAVAEVRRLVHGLRPPALDELGLLGALDEQARVLGATTVTGRIDSELSAAVEVATYRIALEAMTNAARHAGARSCEVRIGDGGGVVNVEVDDDGIGLPPEYRAGVGISSMRERATELGGRCTVERREPAGTAVRATIPLGA
jgi:signal transduction histidine kinase